MIFELQAKNETTAQQRFVALAQAAGFAISFDASLAGYTTFKIGGPADLLVIALRVPDLMQLVNLAREAGIPNFLLGGGSNVLIGDAGVRGLVILNHCRQITFAEAGLVTAESGASLAGLARRTIQQGLAGLEWAVSVPGTIGGAVVGNAGAHGGCIADNLVSAQVLDGEGLLTEWRAPDFAYTYRFSRLKRPTDSRTRGAVVLSATFRLQAADREELETRAARFLAHRRATQPIEASAGSIFQNPPGDYAGRLIEAVGLKGVQVGGVQFSPLHANFIVNLKAGRATDVRAAIELAQRRVQAQFGLTLQPEILFVGEFSDTETNDVGQESADQKEQRSVYA